MPKKTAPIDRSQLTYKAFMPPSGMVNTDFYVHADYPFMLQHRAKRFGECLAVPYQCTERTVTGWTVHEERTGKMIGYVWYRANASSGRRFEADRSDVACPTLKEAVATVNADPGEHQLPLRRVGFRENKV